MLDPPPPNAPRTVQHGSYLHEILGHAGLCYSPLPPEELPDRLDALRLLVTVGEQAFAPELRAHLEAWVERGGAWLSLGGLCGMGELLGADYTPSDFALWGGSLRLLGEGYLDLRRSRHPALAGHPLPLHFFGGIAATARGADVLASALDAHHGSPGQAAVLERRIGAGRCMLIAPDVTGTVVHIQQGRAVSGDGVSAPDGSAPVADGLLKSDDGQVLDWLLDRERVPGVRGLKAFLRPVADEWREVVLRSICYLAVCQEVALPLLWFYPRGLPGLGHLSHDTDGNEARCAGALLTVLNRAEAVSTWCVILPGYDAGLTDRIRSAGHELAFHFDALDHPWSEAEFDRQWREICERLGAPPATNKNHYLRWEGNDALFRWCAARGIRLDQSKGASKTGEAGFNFGTCHPYRPLASDGSLLPVLELPTPTQDLVVFAPEAIFPPLFQAVQRQHGVLHLLFHPAHIEKPGVAGALERAVRAAREKGFEWWTASRLSTWELGRREAAWQEYRREGARVEVQLRAGHDLEGATVLGLGAKAARARQGGTDTYGSRVRRWGFDWQELSVDVREEETVMLEFEGDS